MSILINKACFWPSLAVFLFGCSASIQDLQTAEANHLWLTESNKIASLLGVVPEHPTAAAYVKIDGEVYMVFLSGEHNRAIAFDLGDKLTPEYPTIVNVAYAKHMNGSGWSLANEESQAVGYEPNGGVATYASIVAAIESALKVKPIQEFR